MLDSPMTARIPKITNKMMLTMSEAVTAPKKPKKPALKAVPAEIVTLFEGCGYPLVTMGRD
jgi:hypothetical protein